MGEGYQRSRTALPPCGSDVLRWVGAALVAAHDESELLTLVTAAAARATRTQASTLRLAAGDPSRIVPAAVHGAPDRCPVPRVSVPLRDGGRLLGVLDVYGRRLDRRERSALAALADGAAVALVAARRSRQDRRLALTDGLTDVWNRRYLDGHLRRQLERARLLGRDLALLLIDVDHFKEINDRCGHQVGDELLAALARRLRGRLRRADVLARYGGDEFAVVLHGADVRAAAAVAERLRAAVARRPLPPLRGRHDVPSPTLSVGVAAVPRDASDPAGLLRAADLALYRAKSAGRDRVATARAGDTDEHPGGSAEDAPGSA